MNKLFTKIGVAMVGLAMAVGVGVAVGNDNIQKVSADSSITITHESTFSPALPTSSGDVNTEATSHTVEGLSIKEKQIYVGTYKGNSYLMFVKDAGYLYNTSSLGTVKSVTVTYSSGCSTSAKAGVYFGTTQQSTYTTTNNATIKGQSLSDTWTNSVTGKGYFQLSTSNKNCQITNITIVYDNGGPSVSITSTVDMLKVVGSQTTITATASNSAEISFSSSDPNVATINPSTGVLTATGVGTTTITASAEGASSASIDFKVLSNHSGESENDALTVGEAIAFYENLTGAEQTGPYYITGTVSSIDTSGDYPEYFLDETTFSFYGPEAGQGIDLSDISVGSVVVGQGELDKYNSQIYTSPTVVSIVNPSYTVSFNANNGTGTMTDVTNVFGYYELPSCGFTAPSGKEFAGWKANNEGDLLAAESQYLVTSNVTFYAQWDGVASMSWSGVDTSTLQGIAGIKQLTKDITDTWNVSATWDSGKTDSGLKFGSYTLRIGDSKNINSLPYTFELEDNGKQIYILYHNYVKSNNYAKPTIIENINDVDIVTPITGPYSYTFGAKVYDANNQTKNLADANQKLETVNWTVSGTSNFNYDSTKGQQFGTGNYPAKSLSLSSSSIPGTITSITINTSGASSIAGTAGITVGGTNFKNNGNNTISLTSTATNYTFTGSASGEIVISWTQTSSKALYLKSISVSYSGNVTKHYANKNYNAQKAALEFVADFNEGLKDICKMDGSTNSEALASAWSTLATAFSTKLNGLANDTEKDFYKNLFAGATASARNPETGLANTGDSLQQMLARYDWILSAHGTLQDFLNTVAGRTAVSGLVRSPAMLSEKNSNFTTTISIVVISSITLVTIAGCFVIRRRKEK